MPSSMGEMTAMANGAGATGQGLSAAFITHLPTQQHPQGLYPQLMDRCAGCGVVDSSLLACDDLDGATKDGMPTIGDPSQRQR